MRLIPKTCFFTGHRILYKNEIPKIRSFLREEILNAVNDGFTVFISGGAIGFDAMAAEQVADIRRTYDMIKLVLYLPCANQSARWSDADKMRYENILSLADEIFYVSKGEYKEGCMKKRNKAMTEASDLCISYMRNKMGGTWQTVGMATEKGIPVINIADSIDAQDI